MVPAEGHIAQIIIQIIAKQAKRRANRNQDYMNAADVPTQLQPSESIVILPEHHLEKDLGIDSLDFIALIQDLEAHLGQNLNDEMTARVQTVRDLIMVAEAVAQH